MQENYSFKGGEGFQIHKEGGGGSKSAVRPVVKSDLRLQIKTPFEKEFIFSLREGHWRYYGQSFNAACADVWYIASTRIILTSPWFQENNKKLKKRNSNKNDLIL